MASDGVWEHISDAEAVGIVGKIFQAGKPAKAAPTYNLTSTHPPHGKPAKARLLHLTLRRRRLCCHLPSPPPPCPDALLLAKVACTTLIAHSALRWRREEGNYRDDITAIVMCPRRSSRARAPSLCCRCLRLTPCSSRPATHALLLTPCYSRPAPHALLLTPCYSRPAHTAGTFPASPPPPSTPTATSSTWPPPPTSQPRCKPTPATHPPAPRTEGAQHPSPSLPARSHLAAAQPEGRYAPEPVRRSPCLVPCVPRRWRVTSAVSHIWDLTSDHARAGHGRARGGGARAAGGARRPGGGVPGAAAGAGGGWRGGGGGGGGRGGC